MQLRELGTWADALRLRCIGDDPPFRRALGASRCVCALSTISAPPASHGIAAWRRWDLFEEDPDEELFTGDKPAAVQDQAPRLRLRTHFT